MLYRKLGKTGVEVSILGFGCMRFPTLNGKTERINQDQTRKMLNYALDNGVNFLDTGYTYHNGASEHFLGRYLNEEDLKDVYLSTKIPSWNITRREDLDNYLDEQLNKLQTDTIDFYLVHNLNQKYWPHLEKADIFQFLDDALADGKIKYTGFSFHDELEFFMEVVDLYPWDMIMVQYSYMDEDYQAGREGIRYASSQGLGVAVMEPLRGGALANIPEDIQIIWNKAETRRSPVEWALQYIWDNPDIDIVFCGMSTLKQVHDNVKYAMDGYPEKLTSNEKYMVKEVKMAFKDRIMVDCTSCGYCMPCSEGVNIPKCFMHYNHANIYDDVENESMHYFVLLKDEERANNCIECGECENLCPQMINIKQELKKVRKTFNE
ncbi:MAG: aldo/keto reductase [Methanobacteriaceae archaeon]|nr:aldo/keto reductase [Methanobacteriaceae archaeon]